MGKARKGNLLLVLAMAWIAMFSCFFGAVSLSLDKGISASAETVEYQDLLAIENRSWGAASDEYYFGGYTIGASTAGNAHWLNTDASVNGCWYNGNDALITANNGVDILQYIYVNDTSARDAITANLNNGGTLVGSNGWLTNPAASPVYVETTNGSGLIIKILKAYAGETYTLTFKEGFSLIRNDGETIYLSDDVIYNCVGNVPTRVEKKTVTFNDENGSAYTTKRVVSGEAIGELPAVPAKGGYVGFWMVDGKRIDENTVITAAKTATPVYALEYQDLLGLEDRAWGAHDGEYYFGGIDLGNNNAYFNSANSVCWHADTTAPITANNGVDIMKYIYVNGECARDLIAANYSGSQLNNGSCGCWMSNPAAWPVYVETTNGSGIMIRLAKAYFGDTVTFTFKAGFSLIRNDGEVIYVSNDIDYTYANGTLTKQQKYTLTFDGVESRRISAGAAIGALPAIPAKDGCTGAWMVDGVAITADTVYNYGANKTATVVYTADYKDLLGLEDRAWGAHDGEYYFGGVTLDPFGYFNSADSVCATWHADTTAPITANNGVDIMEYIYVNGQSARSLITANANGDRVANSCNCWLSNPAAWPVYVETTNGSGIMIRLAKAYFGDTVTFTFKAGFSLIRNDGVVIYLSGDVNYSYANGTLSKVTGYTLTFEGVGTRTLEAGATIGALPAVPAKDGCTGVWTIDGVEITADTVYNYGADKTAVAVYTKDVTDTITIEFSTHTTVQSTFKIFITPAAALCANGWWNIPDRQAALIAANNGVDIMEYIYVNDENIRELSDNNRTNNTYPVGDATGWFTNSDQCRPVFVETNSEGIWVTVLHAFSGEEYKVTLGAGFAIADADGGTSVIKEDVEFLCTSGGGVTKVAEYTLSFEGLEDTITAVGGSMIGGLPAVPENSDYEGYWTIDGVEINENTVYTYGADKTAVAAYRKDITKYIALEDRAWGAHDGEYYFGVLDMSASNKVVNGESETYYLNSTVAGCWYHGNTAPITANGGVDIMEYIYVNDKSARSLIEANANGDQLVNSCGCWLSNPAASPVYVETTNGSGIMIRLLQAYTGNYFDITLKSGFSLINSAGVTVYLTDDVTYKYIVTDEGTTFAKGELTDDDLDMLNGQTVTLMNGEDVYLEKTTCRLTLPELAPVIVGEEGLSQVFVGWTMGYGDLYPAGYVFNDIQSEMTLEAVWIGFEMQDGAQVRFASDSSGIRFLWDISNGEDYTNVEELGGISTKGTLIVPTNYLDTGLSFSHEDFLEKGLVLDTHYSDVEGAKLDVSNPDITTMAAALTNIPDYQYSRALSARGYIQLTYYAWDAENEDFVELGMGYVYTPYDAEVNSRSIYEVAAKAYADEENPQYKTNATILNYLQKVADLTWNEEDYSFDVTDNAWGGYEVTDISVDPETATVTVKLSGEVASAVINGKRVSSGSNINVVLGNYIYNLSGYTAIDGGFTFTIGAANKTYDKSSDETLYFESSDADLDFFLNDFFKRHSGYVEDGTNLRVNSVTAGDGAEEFFSHEWMSMSYYWYNSFEGYTNEQGNNSDRIAGLRKFLSSVPVDDYGYVWSSNDRVRDAYTEVETGEQKMGWPFPNNDTVSTAHWEFNGGDSGSWSSNVSAIVSGGLYNASLSNQSSNITFTSNSFSSWTSKKVYTFYAPLLEFEVRIGDATNIEDIYVWYTTSSSTSFSVDKKLSVKDKAFMSYDLGNTSGEYNHVLYLPMYAESAWGESTSTYVKQLKIEIALKSGKTISGNVGLNYVRPTLDTRMSNNNSILISSLRTDYDNTGDLDYLTENITRARKAMNFLMQMYDSSRGLKKESYLVGHGGTKEDLNWLGNATNKSIASSISQGYWDIMYMPEYDFQSNMYFYKAARDLAYLEDVLAENNITVDASLATVKTATRSRTTGTSAYSYDLTSVASTVLTNLRQTTEDTNHTGFWDATDGRFVAGYASGEGKWYDYGYAAWNLEAIYYGIATDEQATAIMTWLNNESSLYDYVFAPRSNTVSGTDMLNGEYAAMKNDWDFGDNCQYGGAIMYTSFYDLMARIDTLGADNAFARLTAIEAWYKEVYDYYVANGTDPYDFYRYYYDNKGIQCQGMGTAGSVGLDREFLESFLPVSAVAYGFFGIEANGDTLNIAPELPADLTHWSMENLAFNFVKYDLTIYKNAIQLNNVRGTTTGLTLTVALDYADGQSVYVNGVETSGYTVENGKVYVTVAMGATIVEVK